MQNSILNNAKNALKAGVLSTAAVIGSANVMAEEAIPDLNTTLELDPAEQVLHDTILTSSPVTVRGTSPLNAKETAYLEELLKAKPDWRVVLYTDMPAVDYSHKSKEEIIKSVSDGDIQLEQSLAESKVLLVLNVPGIEANAKSLDYLESTLSSKIIPALDAEELTLEIMKSINLFDQIEIDKQAAERRAAIASMEERNNEIKTVLLVSGGVAFVGLAGICVSLFSKKKPEPVHSDIDKEPTDISFLNFGDDDFDPEADGYLIGTDPDGDDLIDIDTEDQQERAN